MDAHLEIGLPVVGPRARAGGLRRAGRQSGRADRGASRRGSAAATDGGAGEPTAGGTLVFAGPRLAASLDPVLTSDGESFRILQQVYETLVDLAPGSTNELVGALAETWEGEPDGTEYVFTPARGRDLPRRHAVQRGRGRGELRALAEPRRRRRRQARTTTARSSTASAPTTSWRASRRPTSSRSRSRFASRTRTSSTGSRCPLSASLARRSSSRRTQAILPSTLGTDIVQAGTGPFILEDYIPDDSCDAGPERRLLG